MTTTVDAKNYIAVILTPYGGGSWGRSDDKAEAIRYAVKNFKADWKHLFKVKKGGELKANIYDASGFDRVIIGDDGVWAGDRRIPFLGVETVLA